MYILYTVYSIYSILYIVIFVKIIINLQFPLNNYQKIWTSTDDWVVYSIMDNEAYIIQA